MSNRHAQKTKGMAGEIKVVDGTWGQFETATLICVFSSLRSCLGSEFYDASERASPP